MREIKFRYWNKELKKMTYMEDTSSWSAFWDGVDPGYDEHVLMQYTGLKDKKGKEIYEGDIVKCGNYLNIVNWSKQYGLDNYFFYENEDKEVVGNIYENPKLLTKEKI